jgi:hypothetical protein
VERKPPPRCSRPAINGSEPNGQQLIAKSFLVT